MGLWVVAMGLAVALRPHLQLALRLQNSSLEGAFWQALENWGEHITASLCIFRENTGLDREEVGVRCDLESNSTSNSTLFQQCFSGNCSQGAATCPQSCKSAQTPGMSLNSVSFRPSLSFDELEAALCCSSVLPASLCMSYSPAICVFPRYLQGQCYPECTLPMLNEGLCTSLCTSPCARDDFFCQCMQSCTQEKLLNSECDLPCNTSACDYDNTVCLQTVYEESSTWVTWIVGSLSVGCFLYFLHRVLGVLGCLVYSHMKKQRMRRVWTQTYASQHSRNISDISASEDGNLVRPSQPVSEAPDTAASLTSEVIDRLCPQIRYFRTLAEFQESICTVCLGE